MSEADVTGGPRAIAGTTWPRLLVFGGVSAAVVIADQLSKAWVDQSFRLSGASGTVAASVAAPTPLLGDFVRIAKGYNNGAIFGLFGSSVSLFAIGSLVAIAVIVWYELARGGRGSFLLTLTLGLLLGGAIGNEIDRIRLGYVIDFVDMGIGTWRFYTFNVADASISVSIVVLVGLGFLGDPFAPARVAGHDLERETAGTGHETGDTARFETGEGADAAGISDGRPG
ncbi:MAG: signal peptidase II [Candidatus Limnocylindrales bacterium]